MILITFFFILHIHHALSFVYYVNPSASSNGFGRSWHSPFNSLDLALTKAFRFIDEIWLMGGYTYIPSNPLDRTDCFVANRGVTIYGGFDGTESSIDQRDAGNPPSIISGDIGITNDISDNCYHVLQFNQVLTLDNVIIQYGNANYDGDYTSLNKISAVHRYGGALMSTDILRPTTLNLNNVIIRYNTAVNGGALWFAGSPVTKVSVIILNSQFVENKAIEDECEGGYGGAIYAMFLANIQITNTEFNSNEATYRGGAIYQDYGAILSIADSIFEYNHADGWGGAIFSEDRNSQTAGTKPYIASSTFNYNNAGVDGGAIFWYNGVIGTLTSNIFTSNSAAGAGTAVSLLNAECTYIGNTFMDNAEYSATVIEYNGVDSTLSFDLEQELTDLYNVWSSKQTEWDIYPFNNADSLCYVNGDNTNTVKDGSSWIKAYNDIQECLDSFRVSGGEVWVKAATYTPSTVPQWKVDNRQTQSVFKSFEMYDDIRMYGGFDGTESSRDERNWKDHKTYLSCQITDLLQCFQLVDAADNTLIDGFIFVNAGGGLSSSSRRLLANSISVEKVLASNSFSSGSGLLSDGNTVHVVNSVFHKLFSSTKGGAVYCVGLETPNGENKSPSFINVAFLGNRAKLRGGAISADAYCNFECISCKFANNAASGKGGAIYLDFDCDPTFTDTVFLSNHAEESGGCIAADGSSLSTFYGSNTFTSNSAVMEGGCLYSGSGVSMQTEQGFDFKDQSATFTGNYMSNIANSGHSDVYGWPFSVFDFNSNGAASSVMQPRMKATSVYEFNVMAGGAVSYKPQLQIIILCACLYILFVE